MFILLENKHSTGRVHKLKNSRSLSQMAVIGLLLSLLVACADQKVQLNPMLQLDESNIGHGIEVSVSSYDKRIDSVIGYRTEGLFINTGKITIDQDLAGLFKEKISLALSSMGFSSVPFNNDTPLQLHIDILKLAYYKSGWWQTHSTLAEIRATIQNVAILDSSGIPTTYLGLYKYEIELQTNVTPKKEKNEELLNDTVAGVIKKLITDKNLISFLMQADEN